MGALDGAGATRRAKFTQLAPVRAAHHSILMSSESCVPRAEVTLGYSGVAVSSIGLRHVYTEADVMQVRRVWQLRRRHLRQTAGECNSSSELGEAVLRYAAVQDVSK